MWELRLPPPKEKSKRLSHLGLKGVGQPGMAVLLIVCSDAVEEEGGA